MKYYKVVQNNTIVDAGYEFVNWNSIYKTMFMCDVEDAQFIQSYKNERYYHADWLSGVPQDVPGNVYEMADIIVVTETEYNDIVVTLDGGETIIEPDEPQPEPDDGHDEPAPVEHPMTVAEMREAILELLSSVNGTDGPFKAKRDYYKGDLITNGSHVYYADQTIIKDETIVPGGNCTETSIADILNMLQTQG